MKMTKNKIILRIYKFTQNMLIIFESESGQFVTCALFQYNFHVPIVRHISQLIHLNY